MAVKHPFWTLKLKCTTIAGKQSLPLSLTLPTTEIADDISGQPLFCSAALLHETKISRGGNLTWPIETEVIQTESNVIRQFEGVVEKEIGVKGAPNCSGSVSQDIKAVAVAAEFESEAEDSRKTSG
ncbi:unnamed protein product [Peronospora destructor]|uniref:Uncharacterized protein n=1 Tax=Peronospora destructor TaxID=86335 RepID=A0AAV0UV18_9STRA|nr:unnamed protein product [Peronospora destructor]